MRRPASCQPPTSSYSAPRLQWIARRSVRMWPKLRCVSYFILNEIKPHRLSLETVSDLGDFSASPTWKSAVIGDNVPASMRPGQRCESIEDSGDLVTNRGAQRNRSKLRLDISQCVVEIAMRADKPRNSS